jgi:ubiquitin fusion degradation protein 1
MMDIEFDSAARRFAKDSLSAAAAAAAKREKLRLDREAARRVAAERDQAKAEEEAAAAARAAAEADRREHDLEHNRGVYYHETLRPVLSRTAEERGIVRRLDKVTLPPSAAAALADASHNGVAAFEITTPSGTSTHATLLDFTAPEGAIGMPETLLCSLGLLPPPPAALAGSSASASPAPEAGLATHANQEPMDIFELLLPLPAAMAIGSSGVTVRYRRLPRGTFARVQPVASRFRREVDDVKSLLEAELMRRTTLSVGDTIVVGAGFTFAAEAAAGRSPSSRAAALPSQGHALRVLSLEPDRAVSLIDTDLEVEIAPSAEEEEALAAARAAEERAAKVAEAAAAAAASVLAQAAAEQEAMRIAEASAAAAALRDRQAVCERAAAALPPEPSTGGVMLSIRCPDGSRCVRRFAVTDPLECAFALVEAMWAEAEGAPLLPAGFRLAAQFPRRVFSREGAEGVTLARAGLGSAQEALLVELPTV